MESVASNLKIMAEEIQQDLVSLLFGKSSLKERFPEPEHRIVTSFNHVWSPLDNEAKQLQGKLLESYRRFCAIGEVLVSGTPQESRQMFMESRAAILSIIEQENPTLFDTVHNAARDALDALHQQIGVIDHLYSVSERKVLLVPDTNALFHNPKLESWRFPDAAQFIIVLVPSVLTELDYLEVSTKEAVRDKARRLVHQCKEFRRRGSLTAGVTLVTGVSEVLAIATEPDMGKSLSWLDHNNKDDRTLASVIEVMRLHPRSAVALVTADVNLQNKAEFARVPFIEPPDTGG